MRTKKDPGIRQELFINVATKLFIEKGFDAVSVREVLSAVDDKSASPSVFYYYFPSKEALYQTCIKNIADQYVEGFRKQFSVKYETIEEWMLSHIDYMKKYLVDYLANEKNIMMTGKSRMNQIFILDMREKVTKQVAELWADSLADIDIFSPSEADKLACFLSGGISEMIYQYMLAENKGRKEAAALVKDMVIFSANTIGLTEVQKTMIRSVLNDQFTQDQNS